MEPQLETAKTNGDATPKSNTLTALEAMTWRMLAERQEKLQLQEVVLRTQHQQLRTEMQNTELKIEAHRQRMKLVYGLSDADRIDLETGEIHRVPVEPPEPSATPN